MPCSGKVGSSQTLFWEGRIFPNPVLGWSDLLNTYSEKVGSSVLKPYSEKVESSQTLLFQEGRIFPDTCSNKRSGPRLSETGEALSGQLETYSEVPNSPQVMFREISHLPGIKKLFLELTKYEIFRKTHTCVELKEKSPQRSWPRLSLIVLFLGTQL